MNHAIDDYLSRSRSAGLTDHQISQTLYRSGWTEDQVQALFAPRPHPKPARNLSPIIPLLGIVIILPASYFLLRRPSPTSSTKIALFVSPSQDYSFRYPSDWTIKSDGPSVTLWQDNLPAISITTHSAPLTLDQLPSPSDVQDVAASSASVSGKPVTQYTITYKNVTTPGRPTIMTFLSSPLRTYQFQLADATTPKYLAVYRLVLDSFTLSPPLQFFSPSPPP